MKETKTLAWRQYEAGKEYKRRIGLYETVRRNERFYRGEQWQGGSAELPHPVFNLVRRITDYLVGAVLPGGLTVKYADYRLPFIDNTPLRRAVTEGLSLLEKNAAYRWRQDRMTELTHQALLDAAVSGDGVFYCFWDGNRKTGQAFSGDVRTTLVDNTNLFVADVNSTDLQSQEYVILSGRASVASLKNEAREAGCSEEEIKAIVTDKETGAFSGDYASLDLADSEKTTYLLKFYREDGKVIFEKSTRGCVIKRVNTGLSLYPVAYFNWYPTKNCFHGTAPIGDVIPNQKYVNTAYAMAMKHMTDTAFSKVIYDQSRIPEWSNEVGEAIAAVGGGDVADAVSVVGVGEMQDNYLELIESVIQNTKGMMGATDSALGDEQARNTSAILALQEASSIALKQINVRLCRCIGDLAAIWADLLCTCSSPDRLIPYEDGDGLHAAAADYRALRGELIGAMAETSNVGTYSTSASVATLDKLLSGGYIDVKQYLKHLPEGCVANREALLEEIQTKGSTVNE